MNIKRLITLAAFVVGLALVWVFFKQGGPAKITTFEECAALYPVMESYPEQCNTPDGKHFVRDISNDVNNLIQVDAPVAGATVSSPLIVTGKARGTWYFEASFPVKIEDALGGLITQGVAQAKGDWMTTEFVPFEATLLFAAPTTDTGFLVLKNDNPSGEPARDKEIRIPISFKKGIPVAKVSFGKEFAVRKTDSVVLPDGLVVYVKSIDDSRCKPGVQCIWAGEISVELLVKSSTGLSSTLRIGTVNQQTITQDGYSFSLGKSSTAELAKITINTISE
jgi:hypothetical protein